LTKFLGIQIEVFTGVIIPVDSTAIVTVWQIIKYFHKKDICFQLLNAQVEAQQNDANDGYSTHKDLYNKVDLLEKNVMPIVGHLGITPVTE